jgi:hypothetical protein
METRTDLTIGRVVIYEKPKAFQLIIDSPSEPEVEPELTGDQLITSYLLRSSSPPLIIRHPRVGEPIRIPHPPLGLYIAACGDGSLNIVTDQWRGGPLKPDSYKAEVESPFVAHIFKLKPGEDYRNISFGHHLIEIEYWATKTDFPNAADLPKISKNELASEDLPFEEQETLLAVS